MTVPTIVPSRSATRKSSGFTFSFRAMSLAGLFCGRTSPHSRQRAMTADSSTERKGRKRTSLMFLSPKRAAHPLSAATLGIIRVGDTGENEDRQDQNQNLNEGGMLHQHQPQRQRCHQNERNHRRPV